MSTESLWTRIREKPFKPFRLFISSGQGYDVPHPEFIYVSRNRIVITIEVGKNGVPNRDVVISPLHVTSAEDLPERPAEAATAAA